MVPRSAPRRRRCRCRPARRRDGGRGEVPNLLKHGERQDLTQKAVAPPPTKVGQSPQLSVTVSGTVVPAPGAACRTVKVNEVVPTGSAMDVLPSEPTSDPASISALVDCQIGWSEA